MSHNKLVLPTLRSKMGDWIYYVTVMNFAEISVRVSMVNEIHKSDKLKTLIQRDVTNRSKEIVEYLRTQEQRFFNSIIIGMYDGTPTYQEIDIRQYDGLEDEERDYLNRTFGILTLSGSETLFAIDGQHRTKAIMDALLHDKALREEEITVIFLAHKTSEEGRIRTRRLFSTLNRYAKPVSKNEIIAIDEEDNCAIITRNLVDDFKLFEKVILCTKTRSINVKNKDAFSNINVLYDFVATILTNKKVFGVTVIGEDHNVFTHRRATEEVINEKQKYLESLFTELFEELPCLKSFMETKKVDRNSNQTSLLFRPIGQNVLYSTLKVAIEKDKKKELLEFFRKDDFKLEHKTWKQLFLDSETGTIKREKVHQKLAFYLILKKIGISCKLTPKEQEALENIGITQLED